MSRCAVKCDKVCIASIKTPSACNYLIGDLYSVLNFEMAYAVSFLQPNYFKRNVLFMAKGKKEKGIRPEFWSNLLRATEVEPAEIDSIRGISGLDHPVLALGVDEPRRRIVVVSGEADVRTSAMAQIDIQALARGYQVIMTHPSFMNLSQLAEIVREYFGTTTITSEDMEALRNASEEDRKKKLSEITGEQPGTMARLPSRGWQPWVSFFSELLHYVSLTDLREGAFRLDRLISFEFIRTGVQMGVCPIPLYDFSDDQVEKINSGVDIEEVKYTLRQLDIFQYFFPPPDYIALGLADRMPSPADKLVEYVCRAPDIGHPLGEPEIVGKHRSLTDMINKLQALNLLVEGEIGVELTPDGESHRANVRFKPRESFLSKLSKVISVKIDINVKDLLK